VTLCGLVCLGYGFWGSELILKSSNAVHQDAFPLLKLANNFNLIIHNTNAAIMQAIDGDEDFASTVEEESNSFKKLLDEMGSLGKNLDSLKLIREHYQDYVKAGLHFGHLSLAEKDSPHDLLKVAMMRKSLVKKIGSFQEAKEVLFQNSLTKISQKTTNFQRLLFSSFLLLAAMMIILILMIKSILSSIQELKNHALALSEGDLKSKVKKNRNDELGVLQSTLEIMRRYLWEHINLLDKKVNERTLELENSQKELLISKDQALAASEAKSSFLANMSHEIRTPLNSILGFSQLIRESPQELPKTIDSQLQNIESAGILLKDVIGNLLDLSKIEHGKLATEIKPLNIHNLILGVFNMIQGLAKEKEVLCTYHIDEDMPKWILSDGTLLNQVCMNLMSNAIKFTDAGKNIKLRLRPEEEDFEILVEDEGLGMNDEQLQRVFTPFEQADNSTRRKFGGTGLGLPISKSICELLGGELQASSSPGRGSTFFARMPLTLAKPTEIPTENSSFRDDLTIVVVDDNSMNLTLMKGILKKLSKNVLTFSSGKDALHHLKDQKPDLLLLDFHMPEMNGLEVYQGIPNHRRPITFMVSADVLKETVDECQAVGIEEYITKPLDLKQLKEALAKWFPLEEGSP
jgi:signal transduction histidine kinase/CheY-like chemotaxis protein